MLDTQMFNLSEGRELKKNIHKHICIVQKYFCILCSLHASFLK